MSQGKPKYVPCACGSDRAYPGTGKCRACTADSFRKYHFTDATDKAIRVAYSDATSRKDFSKRVEAICEVHGWPRHVIYFRAQTLGLTNGFRNPWSAKDIGYLKLHAGTKSLDRIAQELGRSYESTKAQASALRLKTKVWTGYSLRDVCELFSIHRRKLWDWSKLGWLTVDAEGRYTHAALQRFLRDHMDVIDLRRIEPNWLKETLREMLARVEDDGPRHEGNGAREAMNQTPGRSLAC